jgi:hypothetical protein
MDAGVGVEFTPSAILSHARPDRCTGAWGSTSIDFGEIAAKARSAFSPVACAGLHASCRLPRTKMKRDIGCAADVDGGQDRLAVTRIREMRSARSVCYPRPREGAKAKFW